MSMTVDHMSYLTGMRQNMRASAAEQHETEDLAEYTDAELKQLYYKGEITRQEYIDETGDTLE